MIEMKRNGKKAETIQDSFNLIKSYGKWYITELGF